MQDSCCCGVWYWQRVFCMPPWEKYYYYTCKNICFVRVKISVVLCYFVCSKNLDFLCECFWNIKQVGTWMLIGNMKLISSVKQDVSLVGFAYSWGERHSCSTLGKNFIFSCNHVMNVLYFLLHKTFFSKFVIYGWHVDNKILFAVECCMIDFILIW